MRSGLAIRAGWSGDLPRFSQADWLDARNTIQAGPGGSEGPPNRHSMAEPFRFRLRPIGVASPIGGASGGGIVFEITTH